MNPTVGRWIGRDPIEENGGVNLYALLANDAANYVDYLGLAKVKLLADAFIPWAWVVINNPTLPLPPVPPVPPGLPILPRGTISLHVKGNGRDFATSIADVGDTSRFKLRAYMEVEILRKVHKGHVITEGPLQDNGPSESQLFSGPILLKTLTGKAHYDPDSHAEAITDCSIKVKLKMSGAVPWYVAGPQPPIDFKYEIKLTQDVKKRKIKWEVIAEHDGFPAHEFFIESAGKVEVNPKSRYTPQGWFSSASPGSTAYPTPAQAIEGGLVWVERVITGSGETLGILA